MPIVYRIRQRSRKAFRADDGVEFRMLVGDEIVLIAFHIYFSEVK